MLLQVFTQPYKKEDDGFVNALIEAAGLKQPVKVLATPDDLSAWGIGHRYENPADDLSKAFHVSGGGEP